MKREVLNVDSKKTAEFQNAEGGVEGGSFPNRRSFHCPGWFWCGSRGEMS